MFITFRKVRQRPSHAQQYCLSVKLRPSACVYLVALVWPWTHDVDTRLWPKYSGDVHAWQKLSRSIKGFQFSKVSARTEETDRQTRLHSGVIHERLDYCNSVLCGTSAANQNKLQRVQNTAARVVTITRRSDYAAPTKLAAGQVPNKGQGHRNHPLQGSHHSRDEQPGWHFQVSRSATQSVFQPQISTTERPQKPRIYWSLVLSGHTCDLEQFTTTLSHIFLKWHLWSDC